MQVDIAIIGGGLVGASLALALRDSGSSVAVIEAMTPSAPDHPSYDDRTLVLNPVSCQILGELGITDTLSEHGVLIRRIHVSDKGRFGRVLMRAEQHGLPWFGRVIEAWRLGQALLSQAEQYSNIHWQSPAKLKALQVQPDGVELSLQGDVKKITAKLVVGADGANSKVRALLNLPATEYNYQQTAIICNATPEKSHHGMAYERFTDTGPLALLPQAKRRVGVVWTVSTEQSEPLLAASDSDFMSDLQQRFGYRLGRFQQLGKRAAYALKLVRAEVNIAHRCVLIGNASHTIHPVSAQGFNLGLRDVAGLASQLQSANDPGQADLLLGYQQQRQPDQEATIRYTDGLARLYSNTSSAGRLLRSAALLAHQLVPSVQRRLVLNAMGYRSALHSGMQHDS